jgi:hypothetical protein
MYRKARAMLEKRGLLMTREKKSNGAEWIFWAEDLEED